MTQELTIGKWRGLKASSSDNHTFSILAFDQRGSYVDMLPKDSTFDHAAGIKAEVIAALAPRATAVLLDPIYSLPAMQVLPGACGLLMPIEKTGYAGEPTARRVDFDDGWTIAKIKRVGASGVKLLVYYHPEAGAVAEDIEQTISVIAAQCREHDLPLFVEPLAYSIDPALPVKSEAFAAQLPQIVRETARKLGGLGVDVLKMEFPVNVAFNQDESAWQAACEAITEVSPVPWALLSAGVNFEMFERQVRVASRAGATGILGGRAIWKECVAMSPSDRATFLSSTALERLNKLRAIVEADARPWTDFYTPSPNSDGWYAQYSAEIPVT